MSAPANWSEERAAIRRVAERFGVDPRFVAAIRKQENGGPGREFGVLDGYATTYDLQLQECCRTVAHRVFIYQARGRLFAYNESGLTYSREFLHYFAAIWAPIGVANDPTNLNANWLPGVTQLYAMFTGPNGLDALV